MPAVLYGKEVDSVPIAINFKEMKKIMSKSLGHIHKIMVEDLGLEGNVMVQAIDRNPTHCTRLLIASQSEQNGTKNDRRPDCETQQRTHFVVFLI